MSKTEMIQSDISSLLSPDEIAQIDAELAHVPYRSGAAIDALKIVQAARGWVSDECLQAIAQHLQMSVEDLEGVATFYNLIYRRPVGEKVILFCDSVSCWLMDGEKVCKKLREKLKIEFGQTSADNKYTLLPVTCLGDCDHAPAMMVGDELHHDLTVDNLDEHLK